LCAEAKGPLRRLGYDFAEVPLGPWIGSRVVGAVAGARTVPQVYVNGRRIGGLTSPDSSAVPAAPAGALSACEPSTT
jgi:glutaredoxin